MIITACFQVREGIRLKLIYNLLINSKKLSIRISFEFNLALYCKASLDVSLFIENCGNVEEIYRDRSYVIMLCYRVRRGVRLKLKNTTHLSTTSCKASTDITSVLIGIHFASSEDISIANLEQATVKRFLMHRFLLEIAFV